ncbi:MAG TPA: HAD family acid phosphatase [Terracidiphilus sp.]|nr:HAD family acid phosphatase [Terracidiphilus sp.]
MNLTVKKSMLMWAVAALLGAWSTGLAAQAAPEFAPTAPGEHIPNLDQVTTAEKPQLKQELKEYDACTCQCGCYAKDLNLQADHAIAYLRQRAAHRKPGEKLALVLDIDETTLSNYPEMVKGDFNYNAAAFDAWVKQAAAPVIPGTLRLYREARRLHVSVIFLTGRAEAERQATVRNLHARGFSHWRMLILRSPQEAGWTATQYKSYEREHTIEAKGYHIVLNVGDQWSDLRGKAEADYSVKYPDPFYFLK